MSSKFIINDIKILSCWGYDLPSNTDCTICRYSLNKQCHHNHDILTGLCSHSFHKKCILQWIYKNKTCPICFCNWIDKD